MNLSQEQTAEALAAIICPYCRENSPKVPYKCLIRTDEVVERVFQLTQLINPARKSFLESKRQFITRFFLHVEGHFAMKAANPDRNNRLSLIELRCRFSDGKVFYWGGNGLAKTNGNEESYQGIIDRNMGHGNGEGDQTQFQIDITKIWSEVSPYLEIP